MLSHDELNRIRENTQNGDIELLLNEIERLKRQIHDYGQTVTRKLDAIEQGMETLENENVRLLTVKSGLEVERDICVGLISKLAVRSGIRAGTTDESQVVIDFPAGQVSWTFHADEAHLFSHLPEYEGTVEALSVEEKYSRAMNPGV